MAMGGTTDVPSSKFRLAARVTRQSGLGPASCQTSKPPPHNVHIMTTQHALSIKLKHTVLRLFVRERAVPDAMPSPRTPSFSIARREPVAKEPDIPAKDLAQLNDALDRSTVPGAVLLPAGMVIKEGQPLWEGVRFGRFLGAGVQVRGLRRVHGACVGLGSVACAMPQAAVHSERAVQGP